MYKPVGDSDFLHPYMPGRRGREIYGYKHCQNPPKVSLAQALSHPAVRRRLLMDVNIECVRENSLRLAIVWHAFTKERLFVAKDYARIMKSYIRADDELAQMDPTTSTLLNEIYADGEKENCRMPLVFALADVVQVEDKPALPLPVALWNMSTTASCCLDLSSFVGPDLGEVVGGDQAVAFAILETKARLFQACHPHAYFRIGVKFNGPRPFLGVGAKIDRDRRLVKPLEQRDFLFSWRLS